MKGYYADPESDCQSFHVCANLGDGGLTKYSLLCPNGTLFNQQYFICDWWFNVDCSVAEDFYSLNEDVVAEQEAIAAAAAAAASTCCMAKYIPTKHTTKTVIDSLKIFMHVCVLVFFPFVTVAFSSVSTMVCPPFM